MTNHCAKFEESSFRRSRDILGGSKKLNGSRDVTTPLSGTVCLRLAATSYGQPVYQI